MIALRFGSPSLSRPLLAAAVVAAVALPSLAHADCGEEIGALMKKRMSEVEALNKITRAHGGKLEPIEACPHLKSLAADESAVVAYMTKNKDWCSLPDDLITKMSDSHTRTAGVAVKACNFAVQMKKMQAQQAQQAQAAPEQAVKLPAGPL